MMIKSRFLAFLALAAALLEASAYHDAEKCTVDATPAEMVTCFESLRGGKYDSCFEDAALQEFQACMENTTAVQQPDVWECGTVMDCAWDTFVASATPLTESLDACFTNTTIDLITCGMTNLDACSATCGNVYSDELVVFDQAVVNASTCDQYQEIVVEPSCGLTSCCDTCHNAELAVHNCVANAYLELSCVAGDLMCGEVMAEAREGGRRFLLAASPMKATSRRRLQSLADHVAEECILMFVNSTTLEGLVPSPADYLNCVYLHFLWMFTPEGVEYVTTGMTDVETDESGATEASNSESSDSGTETNTLTSDSGPAAGGWITSGILSTLLSVALYLVG